MNDLLSFAIEAHGGLARWNQFTQLATELTVGGAIWEIKQQPGLLTDTVFSIDTHREHLTVTPFGDFDTHLIFEPTKLLIAAGRDAVIDSRADPEAAFAGQLRETPWDRFHVGFRGRSRTPRRTGEFGGAVAHMR